MHNRKIPFNYTSAEDEQIITHLFGSEINKEIASLERKKGTGRSSRLLHRFMGDMFIIERNPFLFQELVDHPRQRNRLIKAFEHELDIIEKNAQQKEVLVVLERCRAYLSQLVHSIKSASHHQKKIEKVLGAVVGKENIYFDPFNITAHSTDATDWRLHTPVAVVRPSSQSQVPEIVKAIKFMGMNIIPRGAGTGLTGGATPLNRKCIMINTEKLNRISDIEYHYDENQNQYASMELEAGVITQHAINAAKKNQLIFATDPTSAWACTIGGNIAENAGGKTAVLFGTAIDNILSYRIVMPDGRFVTVKRIRHPLRKILESDDVEFHIFDDKDQYIEKIILQGSEIRKKNLGKDVTNKALGGLPGIQKEGCDGIITSAKFILYPEYPHKRTFCIEFFGDDMAEAGEVINLLSKSITLQDPALIALEHFDEEYIKAIDYKTKTFAGKRLKAVLLADLVANTSQALENGTSIIKDILGGFEKTGLSIAKDQNDATRFWQDRKRLGAIAAHTNAFKLNEDIVLPIESLADFTRFVDVYNLEEKRYNQIQIIKNILNYLNNAVPLADPEWLNDKIGHARGLAFNMSQKLEIASRDALEQEIYTKNFYKELMTSLRGYVLVSENVSKIYHESRSRLIVIATHMHAGDGNVHVNIPVLSNDREMMSRASQTADKIMSKAVELNGVVSGEHGIGVTKFHHLDNESLARFNRYREAADPDGLMNPGKLDIPDIINKVYTPSFNLLKLEAKILKHGSLEKLAESIANCVRCGRCKPECPVFFPDENLFYHPRNKNLAVASLIEALLYITQRTRTTGFKILTHLEEIADHCTICHKCLIKCPVNIDSGLISIKEREILDARNFKHTSFPTQLVLKYLSNRNHVANSFYRTLLFTIGSRFQRWGAALFKQLPQASTIETFKPAQLFKTPVAKVPGDTLYSLFPKTLANQAILIEPEQEAKHTVFYFPGCGSERIFSRISKASLLLLLKNRVRVILPPPYLCCGFPSLVNAKTDDFNRISLEISIIFSQIKDMFTDIDFDALIISCGTCKEAITELDAEMIFETRVMDILRFLNGLNQDLFLTGDYYYHAPCHDSLEGEAIALLSGGRQEMELVEFEHCCSESGTMATSRPDISNAMLTRKRQCFQTLDQYGGDRTILTNCPSCIQGLGRLESSHSKAIHIAEEMARYHYGPDWFLELDTLVTHPELINF